jgi:hypothetical protein
MKGKLILGLIILGAGWLAYANPGMEDFQTFTKEQSQDYLENELGDNVVGRALAQAGSSIASDYVDQLVDRKNYVLFSVFEVGQNLDENEREDEDSWKYLGIGGKFVKLDSK